MGCANAFISASFFICNVFLDIVELTHEALILER